MSDFIKIRGDFYCRIDTITAIRMSPVPDTWPATDIIIYIENCSQPEIASFGTDEEANEVFEKLKNELSIFD